MAVIQSGASATQWTIDTTSLSGRVTLYDINGDPMCDFSSLNNILNALNAAATVNLGGQATIGVNVSGTTGTLTLSFEATMDGSNWFAVQATPLSAGVPGAPTTTTSANGQFLIDTSGFNGFRARISAFTSGSMTVSLMITPHQSKNIAQAVTTAGTMVVSGTVTANQGTANTLANAWPVELSDGTNLLGTNTHPLRIDPTGTTTQPVSISGTVPVSGTVTANIGTTNGLALDTSVNGILVSQGSTTSGEKGPLIQGAVTTAAPTYTTAQTSPLSLTTAGALRIDGSAVTQPVSGTVTANAGTGTFTVGGTVTANAGTGTFTVGGTVTANIGTTNGLALDTSVNGILVSQGSTTSGEKGPLIQGAVTTAAPTYTTAQTSPLSLTTAGALRVDGSGVTQPVSISGSVPVSGTVTSNQGTPNTAANAWPTTTTDGTNTAGVAAASTAATTAQPAAVVALSPNSPLPNLGVVDSGNSSTAALGAGSTFTGTGTSGLGYASVNVSVMAIAASAPPGTLIIEQSSDNTNWDIQDSYSVTGGTASPNGEFDIGVNLRAQYYRIVYTNGSTAQTSFRLQTIRTPVYSPQADAPTQKGVQASTFLPVQEPKDTGRVAKVYEATATAGVTTEAMMTLTPLSNFTAGATGTSFTVTAGKTFRIQQFVVTVRATAATAVSGIVRLRISASGAVTTATAPSITLGAPPTSATTNSGNSSAASIPDGLELSGTMQFGISQLFTATSASVDVMIIGYEY